MTPWLIFRRDVSLHARRGGGLAAALAFCLMTFAVFAFSLGPEALRENAARVLCVAVLLSCLTALPGLFERDHEDGTLEQYLLQPAALEWLVLAKLGAFWAACALPVVLLAPLLALMGGLEAEHVCLLFLHLLPATPALCALGAVGAALTLGLRQGGVTQALIVLPLYMPPLIFAASGAPGALLLLTALALAAVPLPCLLCAMLLRLLAD